jgi:hypothetical protein
MSINTAQKAALKDIANSIETTNFGAVWPKEYDEFFRLWGFFNRIYDILYTDNLEWKRIARFALDSSINHVWKQLEPIKAMKKLASQPCVGNGRNDFKPTDPVRIAFQTLRSIYKIDVKNVCQKPKCLERKKLKWVACDMFSWPDPPKEINNIEDAVYTPLGATLSIIYQIRNNLFHGTKQEITGSDFHRNQILIETSRDIIRILLDETKKAIQKI